MLTRCFEYMIGHYNWSKKSEILQMEIWCTFLILHAVKMAGGIKKERNGQTVLLYDKKIKSWGKQNQTQEFVELHSSHQMKMTSEE
jgi:hypothetical protein